MKVTAQLPRGKPIPKPVAKLVAKPATPCLSLSQRQRIADSLAMLPRLRLVAQEYRTAADSATLAAVRARSSFRSFSSALVAQQRLTNAMVVESNNWKGKAKRRGFLNFLLLAGAGGLGYFTLTH